MNLQELTFSDFEYDVPLLQCFAMAGLQGE